jgi:hypothetical protein
MGYTLMEEKRCTIAKARVVFDTSDMARAKSVCMMSDDFVRYFGENPGGGIKDRYRLEGRQTYKRTLY